jgi:hypothetical protein
VKSEHDQRILEGHVLEGQHQSGAPTNGKARHGGHGWMMIACCIPMLVIAGILVASGAASPGFLAVAVGCTLMMALMMRGMTHGGGDDRS